MAGALRPGDNCSFTGLEHDLVHIIDISPVNKFTEILLTIESGETKQFPIDFPITVF